MNDPNTKVVLNVRHAALKDLQVQRRRSGTFVKDTSRFARCQQWLTILRWVNHLTTKLQMPWGTQTNRQMISCCIQPASKDQQSETPQGSVLSCPADFLPSVNHKHYNTITALQHTASKTASSNHTTAVLRGGSVVGRWTCDLQVAGSIPGRWLSRNIGQLSLASLRGR